MKGLALGVIRPIDAGAVGVGLQGHVVVAVVLVAGGVAQRTDHGRVIAVGVILVCGRVAVRIDLLGHIAGGVISITDGGGRPAVVAVDLQGLIAGAIIGVQDAVAGAVHG